MPESRPDTGFFRTDEMEFPKFARMRKGEFSNWYFQLIGTLGKDVGVYVGGNPDEVTAVAAKISDGKVIVSWTLEEDKIYLNRTLVFMHEKTFVRKVDLGLAKLLTEASEDFRRAYSRLKKMDGLI